MNLRRCALIDYLAVATVRFRLAHHIGAYQTATVQAAPHASFHQATTLRSHNFNKFSQAMLSYFALLTDSAQMN